ncbi:Helix-turn-helix domain-containing protein [Rhodovastum atsumiense]|uniref:Helix-turn-helix domain-containing protein n=1 Tax=Rhodovastum atsumiense TaxID=504468 RepID=A0A5M6J3E3_9PROT|nr:helix-turn-helix domain-containing protein [Rhodovastum atsumiense]KAA5614128.1 helix-turn-helix domain-containing protein [Rhodovastum atsumiense]CAH2598977.1 Helix-turn-helix domain-containing protein [Rhodovastum atsumiense]
MTIPICANETALRSVVVSTLPQEWQGHPVQLRRRQTLRLPQGQADQCFHLQSGALRVCRALADGRRQITAFLFPGDWIGLGEVQMLSAGIEAILPSRIERFSLAALEEAAPLSFASVAALRDMLNARLVATQSRLLALEQKNARERLACFLLEISDRLAGGDNAFTLPMSRYDIADYLCLSSETVCRNFAQFMASGIISLPEPKQVHILRRGSLQFIGL